MYYDNAMYAKSRLEKTIVNTKDGVPVYVELINCRADIRDPEEEEEEEQPFPVAGILPNVNDVLCDCMHLEDGYYKQYKLTDLSLLPVKLGYMNTPYDGACYMSRTPLRSWKQGLSAEAIVITTANPNLDMSWPYTPLFHTITRNYPSYDDAYKQALEIEKTVAFSPYFAVDHEKNLYYKGEHVGNNLELHPSCHFLLQYLNETLEGDYVD
jgi:hypothetical protein